MQPLYMTDSYLREFSAIVTDIQGNKVFLDRTAFYPSGGGQPNDLGKIVCNGNEFNVINVTKSSGDVEHHVDKPGLNAGDAVACFIDWERRYKLMRMHTAAHIIDAILYKEAGALATGNQLNTDKSRIDFSLDVLDLGQIRKFVDMSNEAVKKDIEVKIYFLKREEALKIPGVVKLANAMPPNVEELRIVEIPGIDLQADGGTQVKRTGEIGNIALLSVENKGRNNRRIYYTVQ